VVVSKPLPPILSFRDGKIFPFKNGRLEISGVVDPEDPDSGKRVVAWVPEHHLQWALNNARDRLWNLVTAAHVLRCPRRIYCGLRDSDDDNDGRWCFTGKPRQIVDKNGVGTPFDPKKIYLACLTPEMELYEWRKEFADPGDPHSPEDAEGRFKVHQWPKKK